MHHATVLTALCLTLGACAATGLPGGDRYRVGDLRGEEFLRLRAGPGLGFVAVIGLPQGTMLRSSGCTLEGSETWCAVSLEATGAVSGYVARDYLDPV